MQQLAITKYKPYHYSIGQFIRTKKPQHTAKRKANEIVSHPDFSSFFHAAKAEDIKLFLESFLI
jgi:hypothetical protein